MYNQVYLWKTSLTDIFVIIHVKEKRQILPFKAVEVCWGLIFEQWKKGCKRWAGDESRGCRVKWSAIFYENACSCKASSLHWMFQLSFEWSAVPTCVLFWCPPPFLTLLFFFFVPMCCHIVFPGSNLLSELWLRLLAVPHTDLIQLWVLHTLYSQRFVDTWASL